MEYEIKQLEAQNTFNLQETPKDANILEPRWVHQHKLKVDGSVRITPQGQSSYTTCAPKVSLRLGTVGSRCE